MICANCGAARTGGSPVCAHCGQPFPADPLAGIVPARAQRLVLAVVIDVLTAMLIVAAFLALTDGRALWGAVAVFIAVLAANVWVLLRFGKTLGLHLTRSRVVLADTGSAPGLRRDGWHVTDIRHGADPLLPRSRPPVLTTAGGSSSLHALDSPGSPAAADTIPAAPDALPGARLAGAVLVVDEETRVPLAPVMVIGRDPAAREGTTVVAVPDLARELSKGHFRIGQDDTGNLAVTDLASMNGTRLNGADLEPRKQYAFAVDDVIEAGTHRFRVERRTRIDLGDLP